VRFEWSTLQRMVQTEPHSPLFLWLDQECFRDQLFQVSRILETFLIVWATLRYCRGSEELARRREKVKARTKRATHNTSHLHLCPLMIILEHLSHLWSLGNYAIYEGGNKLWLSITVPITYLEVVLEP
jgi:hypothetical protein